MNLIKTARKKNKTDLLHLNLHLAFKEFARLVTWVILVKMSDLCPTCNVLENCLGFQLQWNYSEIAGINKIYV